MKERETEAEVRVDGGVYQSGSKGVMRNGMILDIIRWRNNSSTRTTGKWNCHLLRGEG